MTPVAGPPPAHRLDLPDPELASQAERLFADLLLRAPLADERELEALCALHPELTRTLRELWAERAAVGAIERDLRAGAWLGPAPDEDRAPPTVGAFECLRLLGRGGMGEVWEAFDRTLERSVALKLMLPSMPGVSSDADRFRREALAAGRLRHANVVIVHGAGEADGRRFLVQELVAGGRTLRDWIEGLRRAVVVPRDHERVVARLFRQLADALAAAHATGIVHRDVKPQNVLLTPEGVPKLSDFGLAKLAGDPAVSRSGEFVGTYPYASPEQLVGGATRADERSDVFSLGATLYECLVLARPFQGDTLQAVTRAVLEDDPEPPHVVRPRVSRDLSAICAKALEKSPSRRYATAAELRDDLDRFLRGEPTRARPSSALARARKWAVRHPTASTAAALATVGVVVVLALLSRSERLRADAVEAREAELRTNVELAQARDDAVRERGQAEAEAAVSEETLRFLQDLFASADTDHYGLEQEPTLKELFERGVERLGRADLQPRSRARLSEQLGMLELRFGDHEAGVRLLGDACRLWEVLGGADDPAALRARSSWAGALLNLGREREAEAAARPLVERWRAGALEPGVAWVALDDLGQALGRLGRPDEAEVLLREALDVCVLEHGAESVEATYVREHLAEVFYRQRRFVEAEDLLRDDALRLGELARDGNPRAIDVIGALGLVLVELGRAEEAEGMLREAYEGARERLGADHTQTLRTAAGLGTALTMLGRGEEAEPLYREAVEAGRRRYGPASPEATNPLNNLAVILLWGGRAAEAEPLLRDAHAALLAKYGRQHDLTVRTAVNLAVCLGRLGRGGEGVRLLEESLTELSPDAPARAELELALSTLR